MIYLKICALLLLTVMHLKAQPGLNRPRSFFIEIHYKADLIPISPLQKGVRINQDFGILDDTTKKSFITIDLSDSISQTFEIKTNKGKYTLIIIDRRNLISTKKNYKAFFINVLPNEPGKYIVRLNDDDETCPCYFDNFYCYRVTLHHYENKK